ncbi:MAG TPA: hypothetical protein PKK43_15990, partial [Spirochaetota bacterium]|nr:hypothetical protein [Spirochaetota bacterium]
QHTKKHKQDKPHNTHYSGTHSRGQAINAISGTEGTSKIIAAQGHLSQLNGTVKESSGTTTNLRFLLHFYDTFQHNMFHKRIQACKKSFQNRSYIKTVINCIHMYYRESHTRISGSRV